MSNISQSRNKVKINNKTYNITGIFTGEIELKNTLEKTIVKQALQSKTICDKMNV
jgi:hypothetical protein